MSGFFSNNGIVPSPLLKRPSAVTTPMNRGGAQGEQRDSSPGLETQVIMDGSQNLGQVRPAGAMSPMSSGTSPRTGAKWGLGRSAPAVPPSGGNSETSQPISEELMPENRRSFRCVRLARAELPCGPTQLRSLRSSRARHRAALTRCPCATLVRAQALA